MEKISIHNFVQMEIKRLTHFVAAYTIKNSDAPKKNPINRPLKKWYELFKDLNDAFDLAQELNEKNKVK